MGKGKEETAYIWLGLPRGLVTEQKICRICDMTSCILISNKKIAGPRAMKKNSRTNLNSPLLVGD